MGGFHSNSFPSEWGQPHLKPLPCLRSRGTFRRSPILTEKIRQTRPKKSLKPLQGKRPTLTTKESAFQPFGLSVGCHWSFVIGHSSLVICPLYSSYLGKLGHSLLFPIPPLRVSASPPLRVTQTVTRIIENSLTYANGEHDSAHPTSPETTGQDVLNSKPFLVARQRLGGRVYSDCPHTASDN